MKYINSEILEEFLNKQIVFQAPIDLVQRQANDAIELYNNKPDMVLDHYEQEKPLPSTDGQLTSDENTVALWHLNESGEDSSANNNDLNLNLEGKNMNIQAYNPISDDKVIPLNFKSSGSNTFEIKITELENIDSSQPILCFQ